MAEVFAIAGVTVTVPAILSAVGKALKTAYDLYGQVDQRRTQLRILLDRCRDLVLKIVESLSTTLEDELSPRRRQGITELGETCENVKLTVQMLKGKSFLWCMVNQDKIDARIVYVEGRINDAFALFNFVAHVDQDKFQRELQRAREQDRNDLATRLNVLSANDQRILDALQDQDGVQRRVEELLVAVLKRVQELGPAQTPEASFLRRANAVLQRMSNGHGPDMADISEDWAISSLEVDIEGAEVIGQGSFGRVFKGSWKAARVAVKQMYVEDARTFSEADRKMMYREVRLWSQLHHPNIVSLYGACLEATYPFLVMQYCSFGNLSSYLDGHPHSNPVDLIYDVVAGMTYLHGKNIVHGDLKSFNILVDDKHTALVADFGLSSVVDSVRSRSSRSTRAANGGQVGTMRWMAPECLDGERPSKASDIYSLALVIWETFSGEIPFSNVTERALLNVVVDRQRRLARPERLFLDPLWDLVKKCWAPLPASRPDVQKIQASLALYTTRTGSQVGGEDTGNQHTVDTWHTAPIVPAAVVNPGSGPASPPTRARAVGLASSPKSIQAVRPVSPPTRIRAMGPA